MNAPNDDENAPTGLLGQARALLLRTMTFYRDDPRTAGWLRTRLERLSEPLRMAVTGRVKSGKSTLINALVGSELAPSDPEERTQVNTVFRYGTEPRITVHTPHGTQQTMSTGKLDPATIRDLQRWRPDEVARLVIESPSPGLQAITLIETPGVASTAVQETGRSALAQILSEADAVLYLTRHPQQTDIQFLHSVHELRVARRAPINTVLALSRADEAATGSDDSVDTAERMAAHHRQDPKVRSFAQYVVPVAGLLAQAGATLDQQRFDALLALAALPRQRLEEQLLSADRFSKATEPEELDTETRQNLLREFGLFGLQRALALLGQGTSDFARLRTALLDESRIGALQEAVHLQFVERQEALRARSVLMAVDMVLRANPRPGSRQLQGELDRLLANAHEWDELRTLSGLWSRQLRLPPGLREEAERLLGAYGPQPQARLGLPAQTQPRELVERAGAVTRRWRALASDPLFDRAHREAVRTVQRSCERMLAALCNAQ
ncbi:MULTISPECIES: dynamin family protein [Actinopolyspora]|uniref:Dynamin family protein n=1 Tax=Actinopolyspora saharensis TaxID=995062 RepID=A0A1H1FBZ0_9ACTN|nr:MULTISPECIES: dynamin family protein [Actinopolyspora]NHD19222.1 isoniazid inducible protein IniC [Actinopolyspora sp. BKK2]NHE78346.1 isoniazid inducible protein IniC [Actinopolyspora sp. BKK1]SDQ98430.1 Dynamin family protein [Actinopolyspora saharensis]